MATETERCEFSDLLVSECACPKHYKAPEEREKVTAVTTARYAGQCPQCCGRVEVNQIIYLLGTDWICSDCGEEYDYKPEY